MIILSNSLAIMFDVIMAPFKGLNPIVGMIVISALTGVLMLVIYKYTSNQTEIRKVKNRIKANFLAIMLFKDSTKVFFFSIGRILSANLRYMGLNLVPLLFMVVPVGLLLIQMDFWFGYRPLQVGEAVLIKAEVDGSVDLKKGNLSLEVPQGLEIQTPPLRIPADSEVNWRLMATGKGRHQIKVRLNGQEVTKAVTVSNRMARLSLRRHSAGFWDGLFYPGEKKISNASHLRAVEVIYRPQRMSVFGWRIHWIYVYFVLSIFFGLALKRAFRVQI